MIIYGLDFTSAPKKQKPITCAKCLLADGLLRVQDVECFTSFVQFEYFLQTSGPWIAGLDFPFGQINFTVNSDHKLAQIEMKI